jgi:hypothetical protein
VHYDLADSVPSPIAKRYSEWLGAASGAEPSPARRPPRRGRPPTPSHFLVLHEPGLGRLDILEFDDEEAATAAYGALELEHLGHRDLEIALLGADSLDTIRRTHGHYFSRGDVQHPEGIDPATLALVIDLPPVE